MDFNKDQLTKVQDQTSRLEIKWVQMEVIDWQKGVSFQFCCGLILIFQTSTYLQVNIFQKPSLLH